MVKDFTHDLCMHMGYPKASDSETVLDMGLRDGRIVEILDRSREIKQERAALKKRYESGDKFQTTEEAFSLNMDLEQTCQQDGALHG
jgi:hypothetical protein